MKFFALTHLKTRLVTLSRGEYQRLEPLGVRATLTGFRVLPACCD